MTRQRYNAEFKKEAARLIIIDGLSVSEVSERLGVNANILYRWKQEHLKDLDQKAPDAQKSPSEMAAEIAQLRAELAKSQRINEILKKTVGYFAKDPS
jgi:transposase